MPNPATVREQRLRKTKAQLIDEIDTLEQRAAATEAAYRGGAQPWSKMSRNSLRKIILPHSIFKICGNPNHCAVPARGRQGLSIRNSKARPRLFDQEVHEGTDLQGPSGIGAFRRWPAQSGFARVMSHQIGGVISTNCGQSRTPMIGKYSSRRSTQRMTGLGVRRGKAALFQWVQVPPGHRSSRKQPEQSWR